MAQEHSKITPEMIQRRRDRSFKSFYPNEVYYNTQATRDTIVHYADGIGDTNPLFRDGEYAKKTRYGRLIVPGCFLYSIQWNSPGRGFTGAHGWYSGAQWEWYRPIYEGEDLKAVCVLLEPEEKAGKMGGGRTWIDNALVMYVNQNNELVGSDQCYSVIAERSSAQSAGKYRSIPRPTYTDADMKAIYDMYEKEEIRGAQARYYEDVKIGDKLGPMAKGPLTIRDVVTWMMGGGSPFYKAHKIAYQWFKRHPGGLMDVPALGMKDIPELVHILDAFAQAIGVERAYDYGAQRIAWLNNLFTNWMGDEGFLWRMKGDLRAFNLIGDTTYLEGKVVKKYIDSGHCCVDVEAFAKNQRGEISMAPHISTVILPSKEHGPVVFPKPPADKVKWIKEAKPISELGKGSRAELNRQ